MKATAKTRTITVAMPDKKLLDRAFGRKLTDKQVDSIYDGISARIQGRANALDWKSTLQDMGKVV